MYEEKFMKLALELAKKGEGHVNPNPMVGAVIVKDGEIISTGYHEKYGQNHAERNAILTAKQYIEEGNLNGCTLYVTLEPCCHFGKTPPCTDLIIQSGIKKVVMGSLDTNPKVAGKGVEILRKNGIEVITGVMDKENKELNKVFFHYIESGLPYVVMKYAMTADGKICTVNGASKWITNAKSRNYVHNLRNKYSSIMVGINTVLKDNPMLTCRIENGKNPIRIVCDTNLRIPLDSNIVNTCRDARTIIATSVEKENRNYMEIINSLEEKGCELLYIPKKDSHIDLRKLLIELGKMRIDSVLLEGGSTLNFSALKENIVNNINVFVAPKIFGGELAKSPVGGEGVINVDDAYKLKLNGFTKIDDDIMFDYEVEQCLQE